MNGRLRVLVVAGLASAALALGGGAAVADEQPYDPAWFPGTYGPEWQPATPGPEWQPATPGPEWQPAHPG